MAKMNGVKDEDKHFDPLFPRINISEAERGGLGAPPRNKMALGEKLTIPSSHRFKNGSLSMKPLPHPSTSTSLTALSPCSHVDFYKKGLVSPFSSGNRLGVFPGYHDLGVRHHSHSSDGVTNSTLMVPEFQSLLPTSHQSAVHWPPTSEHSILQPPCFLNPRNLTADKNSERATHTRLSSFAQLDRRASNGNTRTNMGKHDHRFPCTSSSRKLQIKAETQLNLTGLGELKAVKSEGRYPLSQISERHIEKGDSAQLRKKNMYRDTNTVSHVLVSEDSTKLDTSVLMLEYTQKHLEVNSKVPQAQENDLKRAESTSTRPETLPDADSGLSPKNAEPNAHPVLSIGQKSNRLLDDEDRFYKPSIHMNHNYKSLQESKASKDCLPATSEPCIRKRSASVMEGSSRSMEKLGYKHKSCARYASMDKCHKDKDSASEPWGTSNTSDSTSDASVGKTIPNFVVSPEDVVRAIGQERFWKTRITILHQQRILAAQLFDLHRLVKVQRLMAESPEILFEDNFYLKKSSTQLPHTRKLFAETNEDAKADLQESNVKIEHVPDSDNKKPPPLNTDIVLYTQQPIPIPCPRALVVPPITTDTKSPSLLFHPPPGNQWLIPVRSPSEGLIYKPYTGPLPPTAGILSPVYNNFAPVSLTDVGDQSFLNTGYSLPASNLPVLGRFSGHSAIGQSYQPYPLPSINASGSTSTFEPFSKFVKHPIADQDSSIPICNLQPHRTAIASECSKHLEGCKGDDLQDSTTSGPLESKKVDILSLFPTTPSHHQPLSSSPSEQKTQVIKVVPHSRKSAPKSAAHMFQIIQEERKHG